MFHLAGFAGTAFDMVATITNEAGQRCRHGDRNCGDRYAWDAKSGAAVLAWRNCAPPFGVAI